MYDNNQLKNKINTSGYFVYRNYFNKEFALKVVEEINEAKNTVKYFDNNNNLRRVEKLYDKGPNLILLNKKILIILNDILGEEFTIFKDKFNSKPPGGEGFFAHYDGIFQFLDQNSIKKNGWYEYGDYFINVLVALDKCDKKNGTIEISESHLGNFNDLLRNTKMDGTPALNEEIEKKIKFKTINLDIGDMVFFLHTCPHRSKKNNSNKSRKIIYYTYNLNKFGSKYDLYFEDKKKSKNSSKALVEKK